jgi:CheY-like chemotaxis protein
MSHELRSPLNAILGYAQILKRQENLTGKQRDQLNTIHRSGEHLLALIRDILDLARIEAQKEEVEPVEFNLLTMIHEVLSTTRVKAIKNNLSFSYEELSSVPAMVRGDARKLRQVLINLLDNAVKFTEEGSVTLRVSGVRCQVSGNGKEKEQSSIISLQFQISDTGIGIPEERIEQIFEPFTHEHSKDRVIEGTGLGLAITRRLVDLMGGKLLIESEVGKGSTFTVELVLEVLEELAVETIAPEKVVIGYTCREPSRTKGERKKILIVDDNITNLSMLISLIEPLGFEIETAENGEEAVRMAAESRPDLILMDLLMPVMDGDKALMQICKDDELKAIKIIGVSAAVADKERTEAFAADCDDFISKPVDTEVLLDKLAEQLQIEWIEAEDGRRETRDEGRGTKDEEASPVKMPPRAVLDTIIQCAERGEFTKLGKIFDELESEDAGYSGFCAGVREHARRYDDERIIDYIKSREQKAESMM